MVTLQELANEQNVTYEAIRRCVARYRDNLGEHIVVKGRKIFLDDEGADFIRSKRHDNPVVLFDRREKAELNATQEENEKLRAALEEARSKIISLQDSLITAQNREILTIAAREKYNDLIEEHEKTQKELQAAREQIRDTEKRLSETQEELQKAEEQAGQFKKGLFGFYRKVK